MLYFSYYEGKKRDKTSACLGLGLRPRGGLSSLRRERGRKERREGMGEKSARRASGAPHQGESDAVESMIAWCRKGPPYASVKDIAVLWEEPEPDLVDFHVGF